MQSLSQMLSPLKTCGPNSSNQERQMDASPGLNFQTPLSIMIPPNEFEDMEIQNFGTSYNNGQVNQMWPQSYNQEPLLTSKSPVEDKLTTLNMQIGNQYTYQMHDTEPGTFQHFNPIGSNDPRMNYDNFTYTPAQIQPFNDVYYKCAYEQPKTERIAIRHKIRDDEDIGPGAKRHCGESSNENGQRVIVQDPTSMENVSGTDDRGRRI